MMPDILDYELATHDPDSAKTYEIKIGNSLDCGDSESIYLDFWIVYYENMENCISGIGTFKTLREDNEVM